MAKKSSKKSFKGAIWDFISLVLAGLTFGVLAMPFVKYEGTLVGHSTMTTSSGYELLDFEGNTAIATVILILVILASLLAVISIVHMLANLGVIKGKSAKNILGIALVILALAVLVMSIAIMIVVPTQCSSGSIGNIVSAGSYASWFGLIMTMVVGILVTISSIFAIKK